MIKARPTPAPWRRIVRETGIYSRRADAATRDAVFSSTQIVICGTARTIPPLRQGGE